MSRSNPKTAADVRFEAYLVDHDVPYEYEPPWSERVGSELVDNPDFLVDPAGARVVAEVKQFETTRIRDRPNKVGVLRDTDVYGAVRSKMTRTAREQLLPLKDVGLPLVIVLANPLQADVILDFHHVAHAILGNPKFQISVGPNAPPDGPGHFFAEDYGAFRSITKEGEVNHHPFVSAVVVVHEKERRSDWIHETLAEQPDVETFDNYGDAMAHYLRVIDELEEQGAAPTGSYRWVDVYDLSGNPTPPGFSGTPLPRTVFNGSRDCWYGFVDDAFGEITDPAP